MQTLSDRLSSNLPFAVQVTVLGVPSTIREAEGCGYLSEGACPICIGESFTVFVKDLSVGGQCLPGMVG